MKQILLALVFLTSASSFAEFSFPSGLSDSQAEQLMNTFGVGFLGKWPTSFSRDQYQTQVNVSWNQIDTEKVSRLGSGTDNELVEYPELHFSQELPYQVELGLHASLLGLDNSMNSFGGFVRWGLHEAPYGRLSFVAHATGANYRSVMAMNLYGMLMEADLYLRNLILTAGIGQLRSTASFHTQIFGLTGDQPTVRASKVYAHQMLRASYLAGHWNIGVQGDSIKESSFMGLILGYVF